MTGTGALGACPLAWASGDIVLVATHTDETRSFRQDGPLEVPFVSDIVRGVLEGLRCFLGHQSVFGYQSIVLIF